MWIEYRPPSEKSIGEQKVKEKFKPLFQDREDILVIQNFRNPYRIDSNECDIVFVIFGEDSIAIAIEIKSYEYIDIISPNGYIPSKRENPYLQSENGRHAFMDFMEDINFSPGIWCQDIVLFTELSEFEIPHDELPKNLAYRTLYKNFLDLPPEEIINELRRITNNNEKKKYKVNIDPTRLSYISRKLEKKIEFKLTKLDKERLKKLEKIEESKATKEWIADLKKHKHLIIQGKPSTGKTFSALAIARHLNSIGLKVLFTCFNKVLATDIRRLMRHDIRYSEKIDREFFIDNIDHLIRQICLPPDFCEDDKEIEQWLALGVEHFVNDMKEQHGQFDAIIVDEGQDMREYTWDFLRALGKKDCLYVIVLSDSQAIYKKPIKPGELMKKLGIQGKPQKHFKRIIWRNTIYNFIFATIFSYSSFKPENFESEFNRLLMESKSLANRLRELRVKHSGLFPELDFNREKGSPPELFFFKDPEGISITDLKKLIKRKIAILERYNYEHTDLLIMVPSKGQYYEIVVKSLNELKIKYIDYVSDKKRRKPANNEEIRIVTFHSSRGIEGALTIILGFEEIYKFEDKSNIYNLAFTILTRALFITTLFSMYDSEFKPTCLESMEKLNRYLKNKLKFLVD